MNVASLVNCNCVRWISFMVKIKQTILMTRKLSQMHVDQKQVIIFKWHVRTARSAFFSPIGGDHSHWRRHPRVGLRNPNDHFRSKINILRCFVNLKELRGPIRLRNFINISWSAFVYIAISLVSVLLMKCTRRRLSYLATRTYKCYRHRV